MSDTTEVLQQMIELNWTLARQMEDQRATITGVVVVIATAIQGGLIQLNFNRNALPLTIMLIILGTFGMLASYKLYERFLYNIKIAADLRKRLDELLPDAQIEKIRINAENQHNTTHRISATKIRLHGIWITLHAIIAILGIVYTTIAIIK